MFKDTTWAFTEYLNLKNIECTENLNIPEIIDNRIIENQVYAIAEFNIRTLGYDEDMNKKLKSNVGNIIERNKIYIKRLKRFLNKLKEKRPKSEFENKLYKNGLECLDRGSRCIDIIYQSDYIGLIKRSMYRKEVCLGSTYYNNLNIDADGKIRIRSLEKCCYDMVETDIVYFLNKLKKMDSKVNLVKLIDDFCNMESLDKRSFKFISALLSYPYYSMKYYNKFIINAEDYSELKSLKSLSRAIKKDRYNLI